MSCGTREDWAEALGALCVSVSQLLELTAETLSSPELLTTLGEPAVQCRRIPVAGTRVDQSTCRPRTNCLHHPEKHLESGYDDEDG